MRVIEFVTDEKFIMCMIRCMIQFIAQYDFYG
jgi:hypothetical protein